MPQIIDTRFIDVDLGEEAARLGFLAGCPHNPDDNLSNFRSGVPLFEDAQPLIPESEWPRLCADIESGGLDNLVVEVKNQQNEGSCVGNMWAGQNQVAQATQFGKDKVVLISATSCYKQIGSSPNSGANVEDAYEEGRDVGCLPLDTPANRARFGNHVMPAVGFRTPWPGPATGGDPKIVVPGSDWKKTAAYFKSTEVFICRSVASVVSALLAGFTVGVGRSGHSIFYVRPLYKGSQLLIKYCNSWGEWGDAGGDFDYGFGYDSPNLVRSASQWAYAYRAVVVPSFQYSLAA